MSNQLSRDGHDHVDRNCKTNPFVAPRSTCNRSIDSNHFPTQINEGATTVSRIDRSVDLQKVLIFNTVGRQFQISAALRADDPMRDGMIQPKRTSNRDDIISNLRLVTVTDPGSHQSLALDVHDRNIRTSIGPDLVGLYLPPIRQTNDDLIRISIVNKMSICEDIIIVSFFDNDSGSCLVQVSILTASRVDLNVYHSRTYQLDDFPQNTCLALNRRSFNR